MEKIVNIKDYLEPELEEDKVITIDEAKAEKEGAEIADAILGDLLGGIRTPAGDSAFAELDDLERRGNHAREWLSKRDK